MEKVWRRLPKLLRSGRPRGTHERWAEGILLALAAVLACLRAWPREPPPPPPGAAGLVHRVDLNRAAWYELVDLPGIGETRAREIVRDRREHGPFRSVRELARVRGIGPATVAGVSGFVSGEDR